MSSIEKLSIRGIRSFSPNASNVIIFYTPVTIIVGHNGAGKTTIIECLKYATTGDLPPNAKGGAFVHDPKLSSDTEVKAQIRLKFKNVKGQSMVVTRSMQSTQKKNSKLEQKSLEGLLVTNDPSTGEQVSISTRCAELDSEIPLHLGVSRAVLENVIFCHQEDSFWPLSEPSILKKKFDDIFAATRYTRALDNLKQIRKDLTVELKMENQKLEFLNSEREKARRVEANLAHCEGQIEEIRQKISSLDLLIESVSAGIDRSADDLQALNSLIAETERLEHDLQVTQQAQVDLSSSLQIMKEDDDELKMMLEVLLEQLKGAQQTVSEFEEKRNAILSRIESLTRDYSQHCTKRGSLQAQVNVLNGKKADRNGLLQQLAEMFSIPMMNSEIELMSAVDEKIGAQKERLSAMKSEISAEESSRQSQIQSALSKQAGLEELRRSRRKQIEEAQESLLKLEEDLLKATENCGDLGDEFQEEMEIASEETELAMSRDHYGPLKELERQLSDLQKQRKDAEVEQDRLQRELQKFNQMAEVRARLSLKSNEISKKEEQLQRTWSEYSSMPGAMMGGGSGSQAQFDLIEKEFENAQRERSIKLKSAQEKSEAALKTLSLTTSKLEHIRTQLGKRESDLKELQSKISSANLSTSEPIELQIKRLEMELNNLREKEAIAQSSKAVYGSFLESIKCTETADCPVCEQSVGGTLKHQVEEKLLKLSDGTKIKSEMNDKRLELESKLQILLPLRPIQQEIDRLRSSELPELRAELGKLEESESSARIESEESQLDLNALTVEERRAQLVKRKIDDGLRLSRELCALQHERQGLLDTMNNRNSSSSNNCDPEALERALQECQLKARKCIESVDQLTKESRQKETELMQRESRLRDRRERLNMRKMQRSERERLSKAQEEQRAALERLQIDLQRIQVDIETSQNSLKVAREGYESWRRVSQERLETAQNSLDAASVPCTHLEAIQAEIERLEAAGCDSKSLSDLEKFIVECEERISQAQFELQAHQQQASRSTKEAAEVQIKERCIRDNLRLRELGTRERSLQTQLETRLGRLQGIDRTTLQSTHAKAQMKRSDLMGERSGFVGELRQLEESANRLRAELSGEYAHVTADWQKQVIRVQALQLGSDDLEKYSRALDQAIMKYHALKMDEINVIIRELWTSTYQGTDIDTIEIRADHEGSGVGVNGRCYNYRVIMKKGSVDLDMRGRSSAGQRVLTCIIIRLALAEVFGLHCGILALDEPTTNLDRENIQSLALSLANIIRTRRTQSNFQLILITHDEEFVQLLGREECAEYYYRVFKDENMHSCIERQSISGVLE